MIACEPNVKEPNWFEHCRLKEALKQADIVVALMTHKQFKCIEFEFLKEKILIDTCGVFR